MRVALEGMRWVLGGATEAGDAASLTTAANLPAILRAQAGQIADMDTVADALYRRSSRQAVASSQ
jgi:hypothetical protein